MIKKTRNTKSTLSLHIKLSPFQHIEAQWHRHARMAHLSILNLITSHLWTCNTLSTYDTNSTYITFGTYDTKNTHITLDTKNMCNTLGTNDKKARLSRWTYMTHHITSHWAHMTQRTRLIHWAHMTKTLTAHWANMAKGTHATHKAQMTQRAQTSH